MKKSGKIFVLIILALLNMYFVCAQTNITSLSRADFMFYNVENLFDCDNDPLTLDDEFTANGSRHWTKYKLEKKLKMLGRAILATSQWKSPTLIGLCEIENRNVLKSLLQISLLKFSNYGVIHRDSEDLRGIDVAIIYDTLKLELIFTKYYSINLIERPSREILYSKFRYQKDTLHIIINHWPSRYSGILASESKRIKASRKLRYICDSIFENNKKAKLIIMGDFNDNPTDKSLLELCHVSDKKKNQLINLMLDIEHGTHKYHSLWSLFDQFIISKSLLDSVESDYRVSSSVSQIKFLMENDPKYLGLKPFRTFYGFKYHGGYSDHLPILLTLKSLK